MWSPTEHVPRFAGVPDNHKTIRTMMLIHLRKAFIFDELMILVFQYFVRQRSLSLSVRALTEASWGLGGHRHVALTPGRFSGLDFWPGGPTDVLVAPDYHLSESMPAFSVLLEGNTSFRSVIGVDEDTTLSKGHGLYFRNFCWISVERSAVLYSYRELAGWHPRLRSTRLMRPVVATVSLDFRCNSISIELAGLTFSAHAPNLSEKSWIPVLSLEAGVAVTAVYPSDRIPTND
eukprot:NODE_3113_length_1045_cov_17.543173_g2860_i0.p1 GENE.NODE_3113_length_1045_cov_17.543173_g2860_i0~~NODE_3113_length_1045_cov_17.543173_g2860_i0.p1  ORF type:complete len:233 (-),score=22.53 NODE_3113_length_1045_cov_17.543173_g2860_i0:239-937(-)